MTSVLVVVVVSGVRGVRFCILNGLPAVVCFPAVTCDTLFFIIERMTGEFMIYCNA